MQRFTMLLLAASALLLTACGPTINKQFSNRQVAFIDIQHGGKMNPVQVAEFRPYLQPELMRALQGRGAAPAVGLTVRILNIETPGEQGLGETLLGNGKQGAYIQAEAELWDPTTKASLTKFGFGGSVAVRRDTALGSMLGYPSGTAPDSPEVVYVNLARRLAQELVFSLYGAK